VVFRMSLPPPPPEAPTGLTISSIVGNQVTLRWTTPAIGLPPTGHVLEGGLTPGSVAASIPTNSPYPIFTFAAPNGSFYIRVRALNQTTPSAASNEILLRVNVPSPAPSAPTGLQGLVSGSNMALTWKNTFGGGTPTGVILDVTGSVSASIPIGL